jgi:hypothetical protein
MGGNFWREEVERFKVHRFSAATGLKIGRKNHGRNFDLTLSIIGLHGDSQRRAWGPALLYKNTIEIHEEHMRELRRYVLTPETFVVDSYNRFKIQFLTLNL